MRGIYFGVFAAIAAAMVFGCGKSDRTAGGAASYTVKKIAQAPQVDGVLEDPCWKELPAMEMALPEGGSPKLPGSVRMVYDDTSLYIAIECQDSDAASTISEFDGPVTDEEHVVICIDAGSDTTSYFQIAVAPTGAMADAFVLNGNNGSAVRVLPGWNCDRLRASVQVYGDGAGPGNQDRFWTVEIAVPLSEIVTAPRVPASGDTWRINIGRLELTGSREFSACSPPGAENIHRPLRFAVISFGA